MTFCAILRTSSEALLLCKGALLVLPPLPLVKDGISPGSRESARRRLAVRRRSPRARWLLLQHGERRLLARQLDADLETLDAGNHHPLTPSLLLERCGGAVSFYGPLFFCYTTYEHSNQSDIVRPAPHMRSRHAQLPASKAAGVQSVSCSTRYPRRCPGLSLYSIQHPPVFQLRAHTALKGSLLTSWPTPSR